MTQPTLLSNVRDVVLDNPQTDQVLAYQSGAWRNVTANFAGGSGGEWVEITGTGTYIDAHRFSLEHAYIAIPWGAKMRLKQGGNYKYFYMYRENTILLSPVTVAFFITAGTDYTLENAEVTDIAYAPGQNPIGTYDWMYYDANWASSGTQPSLGDGELVGSFRMNGGLVTGHIKLVMGSSTTFGTGDWRFSIPVPVITYDDQKFIYGMAKLYDSSTGRYYVKAVEIENGETDIVERFLSLDSAGATTQNITASSPFAWGPNDYLHISYQYWLG